MLLFIDGFDHYGPVAMAGNVLRQGVYAETNLGVGGGVVTTNPRTGAYALRIDMGNNDAGVRRVLTGGMVATCGVAFAFSLTALPTNNRSLGLLQWRNAANENLATLMVTSTGQIVLLNGGRGGTEITISEVCVWPGSYQHFEAVRSTAGIEVRINGVTVINIAQVGVGGQTAQIKVGTNGYPLTGATGILMDVDDLAIWSGAGPLNNDFLGDVKVYTRFPSADGADQEWAPSIGTQGFEMINNVPARDQTEYLSAPERTGDTRSTFGIADFPAEVVSVRGVYLATRAWKTDAGNARIRSSVMVGAAEAPSADHAISMAPVWYGDVYEVNPASLNPWSVDDLNAMQTVLERTE